MKRLKSLYRSDQLEEMQAFKKEFCKELDEMRADYSGKQEEAVGT